jgi:hypothetical protein
MRGDDQQLQSGMFSYVALEERIPADHPRRGARKLVDTVLAGMTKEFDGLYSEVGRPSIALERRLRAVLRGCLQNNEIRISARVVFVTDHVRLE